MCFVEKSHVLYMHAVVSQITMFLYPLFFCLWLDSASVEGVGTGILHGWDCVLLLGNAGCPSYGDVRLISGYR